MESFDGSDWRPPTWHEPAIDGSDVRRPDEAYARCQITLPFGHDYDVEPITELPDDLANTRIHYFPGRGESGGMMGPL